MGLTDAERCSYDELGFLVREQAFTPAEVEIESRFDQMGCRAEGHVINNRGDTLVGCLWQSPLDGKIRSIWHSAEVGGWDQVQWIGIGNELAQLISELIFLIAGEFGISNNIAFRKIREAEGEFVD